MRLLMLCREPRLYSCLRLKQAAEESGHQMDILDPNRCLLKLAENSPHFQLYYQAASDAAPYLLPDYDAVLPRFGSSSTKMGCAVLRHFEANNIPCLIARPASNHSCSLLATDVCKRLSLRVQSFKNCSNSGKLKK